MYGHSETTHASHCPLSAIRLRNCESRTSCLSSFRAGIPTAAAVQGTSDDRNSRVAIERVSALVRVSHGSCASAAVSCGRKREWLDVAANQASHRRGRPICFLCCLSSAFALQLRVTENPPLRSFVGPAWLGQVRRRAGPPGGEGESDFRQRILLAYAYSSPVELHAQV